MKKLPIGIQSFHKIREENYLYVDKTGIAVDLINRYSYVFLSRPRRFGKSLFVDTLQNLFEGKKEYFVGLAAQKRHDWSKAYPVIKISFGGGNFRRMERLLNNLSMILEENQDRLGISCKTTSPDTCFSELIQKSAQKYGRPVVILIDEYDKPILDNMDQPPMALEAREELKAFYSVVKDNDAHIRSVIYAWLTSARLTLFVEDCTNKGRIDMSVDMEDTIYLIEFKVDQEGTALEQIRARNYQEKFLNRGKKIVLIGIGFSSTEKNITEFIWEQVPTMVTE